MSVDLTTGPPCQCPIDQCAHFVDPQQACVYRIGNCKTEYCYTCRGYTWFHKKECLKCKGLIL